MTRHLWPAAAAAADCGAAGADAEARRAVRAAVRTATAARPPSLRLERVSRRIVQSFLAHSGCGGAGVPGNVSGGCYHAGAFHVKEESLSGAKCAGRSSETFRNMLQCTPWSV